MSSTNVDWVDGWEIHYRPDGGYGVYDDHGLLAGPFGTKEGAIQAALTLPKRSNAKGFGAHSETRQG